VAAELRPPELVDEAALGVWQGILERIRPSTGYALLQLEDQTAAIGFGVLEAGWLGIFGMATHPHFRRRGAATAVLRWLAQWGEEQGATHAYLQVMEENTAALALYARLGFETLYHYHYRAAPR
jgi:ribosomal protein S18 acetylase RimI-like enzyme